MKTRLYCDDVEVPMGRFVSGFAANVSAAIVASLDAPAPAKSVRFELHGEAVELHVDGIPVPLDRSRGFAGTITRGTLAGLVGELKGVGNCDRIAIAVELGEVE